MTWYTAKEAYAITVAKIRQDNIKADRVMLVPVGLLSWHERLACWLTGTLVVEYDELS